MDKPTPQGMFKAASLLMLTMLLSRVLGYARDVVIYSRFGQNSLTDAYNAAFSIPDFLYMLLVGGALSSAFIPVFSGYLAADNQKEAWRVASIILNLVLAALSVGITVGLIFTPALVNLLVPGLADSVRDLTVLLTRIMFAQAFFMALSGIAMGVLNAHRHFASPAIGSLLYNFMIILVGWLLSPYLGIMGFSIGVVVGAMANLGVQIPALIRVGLTYNCSFDFRHPGVQKVLVLMTPVLVGLSVTHFNVFVTQNLASNLAEGMLSALRTAQRLMQVPVGVFGIAVAVAVFPTLSHQAARKESLLFKQTLSNGLRSVLFLTIPAAAGLIALRTPIVQALFEQGRFDSYDTLVTAQALLFYAPGVIGYSAQQVLNRAFYAIQDTRTPVLVGIVTILLNIGLSFLLIQPLGHRGLALAYSLAGGVNMLLLLAFLRPKLGALDGRRLLWSMFLTSACSLVMAVVAWGVGLWLPLVLPLTAKIKQVVTVLTGVGVGALVFSGLTLLLSMSEAQQVRQLLSRRRQRQSASP